MIVIFHLTVYLAYHVWETYISSLFTNSDNGTSNTGNGNVSPDNASNSARPQVVSQNIEVNQRENNELLSNKDSKSETRPPINRPVGSQSKEGEGDLPQVIKLIQFHENEEGRKCIYDVKPIFRCIQDSEEKGMKFSPPVYIQRYMVIENILKDPHWAESIKKVVDFGCAELSFEVRCLKKLFGVHEILAVDKDRDLLDGNRKKVCPTPTDFLQCRPTPLTIKVLCGSVANTHETLINTDAVIAIELIEHLFPWDLECLPFTIFGFIQPKIVILTTPNADFNVLFPGFSGFRHDDHKFEWSREQFEDWCNNLVQRYNNYTVTFQGIGPGPTGTEHLGCCSQMATFIKASETQPIPEDELHVQDGPYDLVEEFVYPYFVDKRTKEEIIKDEAIFFLNRCVSFRRVYAENDDSGVIENGEIPLSVVMERVKCFSIVKLRNILVDEKWEVRKNAAGNEVVILPDNNSNYSSSENSEDLSENETLECDHTLPYEDENWDCEANIEQTDSLDCSKKTGLSLNSMLTPDECVLSSTNVNVSADLENITQSETTVCNSFLDSTSDMYSSLQETVVNDAKCTLNSSLKLSPKSSTLNSSLKNETQNEAALDHSIYETPQSSRWRVQCVNEDIPSSHQSISYKYDDNSTTDYTLRSSVDLNISSNVPSSESVMSTFDTSTYSTPCCSQLHKTHISKCLSLQQINLESPISPLEAKTSHNQTLIREQKDTVSKSMEDLKNEGSFENHESCSNASKIVDSGYPDSYSDHDMDLDLTPEQFDDIDTESDENISESLPLFLVPVPLVIDDVENGDVANNNRDGEGNNLIADMEEEPIEFEAQIIEELYHEVPNFEGAFFSSRQEFGKPIINGKEPVEDQIVDDTYTSDHEPHKALNNKPLESDKVTENSEFETESTSLSNNFSSDKQHMKAVLSDSISVTGGLRSQVEFPENQTFSNHQENKTNSASKERNIMFKAHNSLTTVLDGYSKFSNCSIVKPVDKIVDNSDLKGEGINTSSRFQKSELRIGMLKTETEEDKEETKCTEVNELQHLSSSLQQDNNSVISLSEYRSAESLISSVDEEMFKISDFPAWLLNIDCDVLEEFDLDSSSVFSLLDNESFEGILGLNFDVPVDSRGGGDPQGDTVNFPINM